MRCVKPADGMLAERERLAVCECPRRVVSKVVDGYQGGNRAAQGRGLRGCREPFVERTAFIRLNVGKGDVPKTFHRHRTRNRLADQREQFSRSVWKSSGSSPKMRYWVNENQPGPPSMTTGVLMR